VNPASTSFLLDYHGCDRALAEKIFAGNASLAASRNDYDWLGNGIYFWEYNAQRARDFAIEISRQPRSRRQKISSPAVVGAILDVGFCLNLLDSRFIPMVREAHAQLVRYSQDAGAPLPQNTGGSDLLNRKLDCAVMRTLHQLRQDAGEEPLDTVRAAFIEGDRLYAGAGFATKTHIQLCVRNPRCIKGYFRPLDDEGRPITFS
jgi:hypothetical protein